MNKWFKTVTALLLVTSLMPVYAADNNNIKDGLFSRGKGFWSTPADEKATGFFNKLTPRESQRENWYQVTPYVAEF